MFACEDRYRSRILSRFDVSTSVYGAVDERLDVIPNAGVDESLALSFFLRRCDTSSNDRLEKQMSIVDSWYEKRAYLDHEDTPYWCSNRFTSV